MLDSLQQLQQSYRRIGGHLVIRSGDPLQILPQLVGETGAVALYWNQVPDPQALRQDQQVTEALQAMGIAVKSFQDMLLHGPQEILTQAGHGYSVYTPFWRNWIQLAKTAPYPTPGQLHSPQLASCEIPPLSALGRSCDQVLPTAGEAEALRRLEEFCGSGSVLEYQEQRNSPALEGTSRLSPHLRWGTIGIRQIWQATVEIEADLRSEEAGASLQTWRQELAWREFYKQVLAHWPQVVTEPFRPGFGNFEWENRQDLWQAWCEGMTGYPIVDAAMRQLNQTGWMHNRCRMIVASFLTKDLLIDWRWGEQYFMQKLVDGDLSANNGGWQWSASVGTDAKPLRIFNPATQAAKFDPEGEYIRRYVPELAGLDAPLLLDMSDSKLGQMARRQRQDCGYPTAIVDHRLRQEEFKRRYHACR
jgi:deoxyribodipyrimidine photo-lyase